MLGMPVFVMKATMPRSEYMGWLSFLRYEEPDINEIQLATLSMLVANALGGKSKVKDFIVRKPDNNNRVSGQPKEMEADAIRSVFSGIAVPQK